MMTIELGAVVAALNQIANPRLSEWMAVVGEHEKGVIEHRIETEKTAPDGEPWAPWQPSTLAKRTRKGNAGQGLLWDTGHLLHDQTYATDMTHDLIIGTNVEYAPFLQDGTRHMVARPFVGWSSEDEAWLGTSLIAHLQSLIP